jgi:CRP-like cAMP-binding protein
MSRGNLPTRPDPTKDIDLGTYPDRDPTLVELVMGLRSFPGPFATANMEALIAAARRMTFHRVEAGHVFFKVGDPSDHSIRIVYGRVRCTAPSGEHVDVGAGFVVGALDAWADVPRSFSARAETPVVCWRTPMEDLLSVLEMHPSLALRMLAGVASSLIATGLTRAA